MGINACHAEPTVFNATLGLINVCNAEVKLAFCYLILIVKAVKENANALMAHTLKSQPIHVSLAMKLV